MGKGNLNSCTTGLLAGLFNSVVNSLAVCYCNAWQAGLCARCDLRMINVKEDWNPV
jgi:hypothetical protein